MAELGVPFAAILGGFVMLAWSADRMVFGASATARNFGVSPLIIGLTIVGFGTSAPEMLVSAVAAFEGNPGLGIGNALGSNITNIGMVLGVTALVVPLTVTSRVLKRELPLLLVIMLATLSLMLDGGLSRWDGAMLMLGLVAILIWLVRLARRPDGADPMAMEYEAEIPEHVPTGRALVWLLAGIVLLLLSSQVLVWGAVEVAEYFGVSDLVIGLTVIAIGTSLPELSASIASALKGEHDIAIGNVIGSNMFNLLGVLAMPGVIRPGPFPMDVLTRDFPIMIGLTLVLFLSAYGMTDRARISRVKGGFLLGAFMAYLGFLYVSAT
ncbi:MAG TPA: calcium/sodium antiporter [Gammaproteobacteria bacterium]|nr:calcium/sodium antiporter [Gammaproteobacteria bacterium]